MSNVGEPLLEDAATKGLTSPDGKPVIVPLEEPFSKTCNVLLVASYKQVTVVPVVGYVIDPVVEPLINAPVALLTPEHPALEVGSPAIDADTVERQTPKAFAPLAVPV